MAISETLKDLERLASDSESVLVSYSGGKDSKVLLDLARRFFKNVACFYMYFVPNLKYDLTVVEYPKSLNIPIIQYPHPVFFTFLKNATYCNDAYGKLPTLTVLDVYAMVRQDTGYYHILHGAKKADSFWRRRQFGNTKGEKYRGLHYPLKEWNKLEVISYLKSKNIHIPEMSLLKQNATGIGLRTPELLYFYDNHRDDFNEICKYFPYARSVIYRRDWYGIK